MGSGAAGGLTRPCRGASKSAGQSPTKPCLCETERDPTSTATTRHRRWGRRRRRGAHGQRGCVYVCVGERRRRRRLWDVRWREMRCTEDSHSDRLDDALQRHPRSEKAGDAAPTRDRGGVGVGCMRVRRRPSCAYRLDQDSGVDDRRFDHPLLHTVRLSQRINPNFCLLTRRIGSNLRRLLGSEFVHLRKRSKVSFNQSSSFSITNEKGDNTIKCQPRSKR